MKPILKRSFLIFLFFSTFITIFPPFKFGGEKLRTLTERKQNYNLAYKLPIKKYDFIFGSNQKPIQVGSHIVNKKIYSKDSVNQGNIFIDATTFEVTHTGVDSFFTRYYYAYKLSNYGLIANKKIDKDKKTRRKILVSDGDYRIFGGGDYSKDSIFLKNEYDKKIMIEELFNSNSDTTVKMRVIKDYNPYAKYNIIFSFNFQSIKDEYNKEPKLWKKKEVLKLDSTKNYQIYKITKPKYINLHRELCYSDFAINLMLAFLTSLIIGFGYYLIVSRRKSALNN